MTSVVHCKRDRYDIYIGRGRCPITGKRSKWGNPFPIDKNHSREDVVNMYRVWLQDQYHLIQSLHELKDKTLGCWCKQKPNDNTPCHGDVLKEFIEKMFM